GRLEEVLGAAFLRREAIRHPDRRHRQPRRRRHGQGKRAAPVAAGQAAARRPGALHRQPVAAIPALAVQGLSSSKSRKRGNGVAKTAAPFFYLKYEANFADRWAR